MNSSLAITRKPRRKSGAVSDLSEMEVREQLVAKRALLANRSVFASSSTSPIDPLEARLTDSINQLQLRLDSFSSVEHVVGRMQQIEVDSQRSPRVDNRKPDQMQTNHRDRSLSPKVGRMGKMPAAMAIHLEEQAAAKDPPKMSRLIQPPRGPFDQLSQMAQIAKMQAFMAHQPDFSDEEDWDDDEEDDDEEEGYEVEDYVVKEGEEKAKDDSTRLDAVMEEQGQAIVADLPWDQVIAVDVARTAEKNMLAPKR